MVGVAPELKKKNSHSALLLLEESDWLGHKKKEKERREDKEERKEIRVLRLQEKI